jgi:hypothetical protein
MTKSTTRRYSIEVKDAKTGIPLILTTVDWTSDQKRLAMALIGRLADLHDANRSKLHGDHEPEFGKTRFFSRHRVALCGFPPHS